MPGTPLFRGGLGITGGVGESKGGGGHPGRTRLVASLPGRVGRRENEDRGRFRDGCGTGLRMNNAEIAIIALLVASLALQVILARTIGQLVTRGVGHLDQSLAAALTETMSSLPDALQGMAIDLPEPPNPIQALIFEMIQSKMKPPNLEVKEISRSDDGKFT